MKLMLTSSALSMVLMISGESKDFKNNIDLKVMRKIIPRVPESSLLHIVYVQSLQTSYFGQCLSETYDDFKKITQNTEKKVHEHLAFSKIMVDESNNFTLTNISNLPFIDSNSKCIILFIELSTLILNIK